jgi:cytosine/adenosine deaminase-related metal-dependent hydrolase
MADAPLWTLTARWVFPGSGPPLAGGTVTVAGERIAAVEPRGARRADLDLGDALVLPGLVNAHTHLDLSGIPARVPLGTDFTDWLRGVIAYRRGRTLEEVRADVETGLSESLRCGVTLLGDIAGQGLSWDALAAAPLRAVVFHEMLGLSAERARRAWWDLLRWLRSHQDTPTCRAGVSPHAPYSVRASIIRATAWNGLPMAVHLAESAAERELLEHHHGPFVDFLQGLGVWDAAGLAKSPEDVLRLCRRASSVALIHCNYLGADAAFPPGATVVYCPRTHAYFGHPPHPVAELLSRGVRVALGTDSRASNPDLDPLAEARFLHRLRPELPGDMLLRLMTINGAEALGWADETGSLAAGKSADLIVLPLPASLSRPADPHDLIFDSEEPVRSVLWRGQWRDEKDG